MFTWFRNYYHEYLEAAGLFDCPSEVLAYVQLYKRSPDAARVLIVLAKRRLGREDWMPDSYMKSSTGNPGPASPSLENPSVR